MSSGPPSQAERLRSLRPWFLVAAMVLTWLAGVQGLTSGCGTAAYLREGSMPDEMSAIEKAKAAPEPKTPIFEFVEDANKRAVAESKQVMMPLSIARVLLSLLLVAASAMVLTGRPRSRNLVLQAIVANAAFAIVAFVLTAPVRDHWIDAVVRAQTVHGIEPAPLFPMPNGPEVNTASPAFWRWGTRIQFAVFELGLFGVALLAVLARRTRVFMDAVARAEDGDEREDQG